MTSFFLIETDTRNQQVVCFDLIAQLIQVLRCKQALGTQVVLQQPQVQLEGRDLEAGVTCKFFFKPYTKEVTIDCFLFSFDPRGRDHECKLVERTSNPVKLARARVVGSISFASEKFCLTSMISTSPRSVSLRPIFFLLTGWMISRPKRMSFNRSPCLIGCPCLRSKVRICRSTETTTPSRGGNIESIWLTMRSRLSAEAPKAGAVPKNQNTHTRTNDRLCFLICLHTLSSRNFWIIRAVVR